MQFPSVETSNLPYDKSFKCKTSHIAFLSLKEPRMDAVKCVVFFTEDECLGAHKVSTNPGSAKERHVQSMSFKSHNCVNYT